MDLIFVVLFWAGFAAILFCVFVERGIIMGRLSSIRNKRVPIAFTQKTRFQLIEDYKNEHGSGREDVWYKYLRMIYSHGLKYVFFMFGIAVLAFIF